MTDAKPGPKGELLLESLAAIAADVTARILEDVKPEVAKLLADEIATRFSDDWGGETYYIPKGRVFRRSAIYREIWNRFAGSNQVELAREYGMSVIHIYRILARERERDRTERQLPLSGVPSQE